MNVSEYAKQLVKNIPHKLHYNHTKSIKIVIEGGAFNGNYLIGWLYFLKEMQSLKYISIKKVSCCSISTIMTLLFFMDKLDLGRQLYQKARQKYIDSCNFDIFDSCILLIKKHMEPELYKKVSGIFYITYNNVDTKKKVIRKKYKSNDDLLDCCLRSCFLPFIIDKSIVYNKKYIDGITPYIFKSNNLDNIDIMYIRLINTQHIPDMFSVKHEITNLRRVMVGLLDATTFFTTNRPTIMCSYIHDWSYKEHVVYKIHVCFEIICVYITAYILHISQYITDDMKNSLWFKLITNISNNMYEICIHHYFI